MRRKRTVNCLYCSIDTAGKHAGNCPMRGVPVYKPIPLTTAGYPVLSRIWDNPEDEAAYG